MSLAEMEDLNAIGVLKLWEIKTDASCMTHKEMKKTSSEPIERKSDVIDEYLDRVHIDVTNPMNVKINNKEE